MYELGAEMAFVTPRDVEAVERLLDAPVDLVSANSPPFMHVGIVCIAVWPSEPQ